jgi:hypothetical protein
MLSGLAPSVTVTISATFMFGIFAVSLFFVSQRLLKLNLVYSILLTVFVIFQIAVLRTAWDLHRDIFGLSTMLLSFYLIQVKKENPKSKVTLAALILSTAAASSTDALISSLFVVSLIIYAIITRLKIVILCTAIAMGFFTFAVIPNQNIFHQHIERIPAGLPSTVSSSYNPINLLILFLVVDGLLILTGVIGFIFLKNNLLKVPLLICIVASLSWLVFPNTRSLVADRWTVLGGIFLSIFAAYGIIRCIQKLNVCSERTRIIVLIPIVGIFVTMGSAYMVLPNDKPFFLYGMVRNNIQTFMPTSMQVQISNSQDIQDNVKLTATISWLNNSTGPNAIIVGDKDWRGWMEIGLKDHRTYKFSENLSALIGTMNSKHQYGYLIVYYKQEIPAQKLSMVYSNDRFRIFRVES